MPRRLKQFAFLANLFITLAEKIYCELNENAADLARCVRRFRLGEGFCAFSV